MGKHLDETAKEFIRFLVHHQKHTEHQAAALAKVSRSTVSRVLAEPAPENRHIDTRKELKAALAGIDATITLAQQESEPDLRLIGGLYDSKAKLLLKLEEAESKATPTGFSSDPRINPLAKVFFPSMPAKREPGEVVSMSVPQVSVRRIHDPTPPGDRPTAPKDGPSAEVRAAIKRAQDAL